MDRKDQWVLKDHQDQEANKDFLEKEGQKVQEVVKELMDNKGQLVHKVHKVHQDLQVLFIT